MYRSMPFSIVPLTIKLVNGQQIKMHDVINFGYSRSTYVLLHWVLKNGPGKKNYNMIISRKVLIYFTIHQLKAIIQNFPSEKLSSERLLLLSSRCSSIFLILFIPFIFHGSWEDKVHAIGTAATRIKHLISQICH